MATKTQGLRIRTKLLFMVLLLVSISILVGAGTYYSFSKILAQSRTPLLPILEATHNIDSLTAKARRFEKEFFLFSSIGNKAEYKRKQKNYYNELEETLNSITPLLRQLILDKELEHSSISTRSNLIHEIRKSLNGTLLTLAPLSDELFAGKSFTQVPELYAIYKENVHSLEGSVLDLRKHISQAINDQNMASIIYEADMVAILLAVGCGLIVFGVIFGLVAARRLTNPLEKILTGIKAIGQGEVVELSAPSKDEFANIASSFNETINQLKSFIKTDEERQMAEDNVINFLEVVSEAADGDLTLRAPVTEDAFGSIADAYNLMIESLADLLTDTTINAEEVGEESQHLLEIFQQIKQGADNQLEYVANATDAAEDTAQSATQIAEKASLAQRASDSVEEATTQGNERVNMNIEGMQLIRVTVQVINKKMKSLSERMLEIGTISQLISDVATRTTILAMNASIEASRAGEQGRGFLVISDEIKRLADEASEATRQIGGIIKAIQTETNEVTLALEEETSTVEEQTRLAQDTGEALTAIQKATNESKQVVTEITTLSQEQQKISEEMVASIRKMADITASTSLMITESAEISEGLNGVSESLLQSLGQFRLTAPAAEVEPEVSFTDSITEPEVETETAKIDPLAEIFMTDEEPSAAAS